MRNSEPFNQQTNQMNQNSTSVSVFMSAAWISMRPYPEELRTVAALQPADRKKKNKPTELNVWLRDGREPV